MGYDCHFLLMLFWGPITSLDPSSCLLLARFANDGGDVVCGGGGGGGVMIVILGTVTGSCYYEHLLLVLSL